MKQGTEHADSRPRLCPEGELTIYRARAFRDELSAALDEGHGAELDLSRVTECDTAALQVILAALRASRAQANPLELLALSQPVRDLVALYGLEAELAGRA